MVVHRASSRPTGSAAQFDRTCSGERWLTLSSHTGSYDVAPADRLAFSLARAALATSEHTALEHVLRVHADLEAQTRDASGETARLLSRRSEFVKRGIADDGSARAGHRVIAYVLPALNGLRRAYRESTIPTWPASALEPSLAPIDDLATSQLRITFAASEWDHADDDGTESGRAAIVTLEAYENGSQLVISPATNALASLELQQTYWSSLLLSSPTVSSADNEQRWKLLRESKVGELAQVDAARRKDAERIGRQAIGLWHAELTAVEEDRADLSATELLISSLVSRCPRTHAPYVSGGC